MLTTISRQILRSIELVTECDVQQRHVASMTMTFRVHYFTTGHFSFEHTLYLLCLLENATFLFSYQMLGHKRDQQYRFMNTAFNGSSQALATSGCFCCKRDRINLTFEDSVTPEEKAYAGYILLNYGSHAQGLLCSLPLSDSANKAIPDVEYK